MRKLALSDEVLLSVQKPARYLGNEANAVYNRRDTSETRPMRSTKTAGRWTSGSRCASPTSTR